MLIILEFSLVKPGVRQPLLDLPLARQPLPSSLTLPSHLDVVVSLSISSSPSIFLRIIPLYLVSLTASVIMALAPPQFTFILFLVRLEILLLLALLGKPHRKASWEGKSNKTIAKFSFRFLDFLRSLLW